MKARATDFSYCPKKHRQYRSRYVALISRTCRLLLGVPNEEDKNLTESESRKLLCRLKTKVDKLPRDWWPAEWVRTSSKEESQEWSQLFRWLREFDALMKELSERPGYSRELV